MDAGDVLNEDLCDRILEGDSGYFLFCMQMVKKLPVARSRGLRGSLAGGARGWSRSRGMTRDLESPVRFVL